MCFRIKIRPSNNISIYYLLYRLHNSNLIWIIKISNNLNFLQQFCELLTKEEKIIGKYYIVERYENEKILWNI